MSYRNLYTTVCKEKQNSYHDGQCHSRKLKLPNIGQCKNEHTQIYQLIKKHQFINPPFKKQNRACDYERVI